MHNWLFGAHSQFRDALYSHDKGRILVLPQIDNPDFVDFQWEALPFLRSRYGMEGDGSGELKEMSEEELWLVCKIKR